MIRQVTVRQVRILLSITVMNMKVKKMRKHELKSFTPDGFILIRTVDDKWKLIHKNDPAGYICKRNNPRLFANSDVILHMLAREFKTGILTVKVIDEGSRHAKTLATPI